MYSLRNNTLIGNGFFAICVNTLATPERSSNFAEVFAQYQFLANKVPVLKSYGKEQ